MKHKFILLMLLLVLPPPVWATDEWYTESSLNVLGRVYSGSIYFDSLNGAAAIGRFDYLEQYSYVVGGKLFSKQYKEGLTDSPTSMDEAIGFMSVEKHLYLDEYPGKLSYRVDAFLGQDRYLGLTITNTGPPMGSNNTRNITITDNFSVVSARVSYLSNDKTFYWDLGAAYSQYNADNRDKNIDILHPNRNNLANPSAADDIQVTQFTPTLGLGFNRAMDWLQFRVYLIALSDSDRVAFKKSTSAFESKWIHWFSYDAFLNLDSVNVTLLAGERLYAIDNDSYSVYNSSDLQKASFSTGVKWTLGEDNSLYLHVGMDRFQDLVEGASYNSNYLFAQLSTKW